jgi:hypothetical protein
LFCEYSYSAWIIITVEMKVVAYVDPSMHRVEDIVVGRGATSF